MGGRQHVKVKSFQQDLALGIYFDYALFIGRQAMGTDIIIQIQIDKRKEAEKIGAKIVSSHWL